jgi:predicted AAA+ superfamily ATPase
MNYIFLDEIQQVDSFEKVLNSLFHRENVDIYITGSNAYLLSGELATLLSGRYVTMQVQPFSFAEYMTIESDDSRKAFHHYLNYGGFPYAVQIEKDEVFCDYMEGILNTVLVKDVLQRKKQSDTLIVESIVKFLMSSVGSLISIKKIADTLTSMNRKTSSPTVESYLSSLLDAFIFYKVDRYDIYGKKFLQLNSKYYVADLGLKHALLGNRRPDLEHDLENIVYLELLRRRYNVSIGNIDKQEVDFIAERSGDILYFQVSASVLDSSTFAREIAPLLKIQDNYPKYLLTLDEIPTGQDGINQINLIDWLLN